MPRSNYAHAPQLLSPHSRAWELQLLKPMYLPACAPQHEKTTHQTRVAPLAATRESLCGATKTQRGQIKKDCLGIPWQSRGQDSVLTAGARGSISGSGTKIPQALREEKKKDCKVTKGGGKGTRVTCVSMFLPHASKISTKYKEQKSKIFEDYRNSEPGERVHERMMKESCKEGQNSNTQNTVPRYPESSVQFSSVAQSCPTLCDPKNRSMPGLPVHHQLPESTQTHVHWVSDAIQPSHPLSSSSPPALNLSQHQGVFR